MTATLDLQTLPRYDPNQTYAWNYEHAPDPVEFHVPSLGGLCDFCGLPVASPLGIAAGPLLNGRWVLYYASLGFDVLTYKTVRSGPRPCYPLPNLLPVECGQLNGSEGSLPASTQMRGSWAVSFGMPSQEPGVWRADIEATRRRLSGVKVLSVSVVGTIQEGWTLDDLANDYARCAKWAVESGADCIESNFSCPNVPTCDGQLYQNAASSALVAQRVREAIGRTPYILKIGHLTDRAAAAELLRAVSPFVDALAMTNSVATTVIGPDGKLMFDGQRRGICGDAVRQASLAQTRLFAGLVREMGLKLALIGVGGASTAGHVREYLAAGATSVHLATAAMVNPAVGAAIREGLLSTGSLPAAPG